MGKFQSDSESHNGSVNYAYDAPIATVSDMYSNAIEAPHSNGTKMNGGEYILKAKQDATRYARFQPSVA